MVKKKIIKKTRTGKKKSVRTSKVDDPFKNMSTGKNKKKNKKKKNIFVRFKDWVVGTLRERAY